MLYTSGSAQYVQVIIKTACYIEYMLYNTVRSVSRVLVPAAETESESIRISVTEKTVTVTA